MFRYVKKKDKIKIKLKSPNILNNLFKKYHLLYSIANMDFHSFNSAENTYFTESNMK